MTKTYVRFFYPGLLFSETSDKALPSREVKVTLPPRAFGYLFFDREEQQVDGETLVGKEKNHSGIFYVGKEVTAAEALAEAPLNSPLKFNIEANEIKRLVKTKTGGFYRLNDDDRVIEA